MKKKSIDGYYLEIEEEETHEIEEEKFELPSERESIKKGKIKNLSFNKEKKYYKKSSKKLKWIIILSIAGVLYLFYDQIILFLLDILKKNPTSYKYFLYLQSQISNNTIPGLFLLSILGSIFFLVFPSEALFIYFLNTTNYFGPLIIILMIAGNLIGLLFNYFFGFILGERILRWMFKENFESYKNKIKLYGGYVLFFGNIFPGPIELLSVFYGGFKFNLTKYVFLAFMGRLIKYVILFIAFVFFWDQIMFYYNDFLGIFSKLI